MGNMTIYIVRHGQTEENLRHILQGHMPGTLTEEGKWQVRGAADRLADEHVDFKCIVSSDLKRAVDSAGIISERLGIPVVPHPILRERDWGKYTGMPVMEAKEKYYHDGRWDFPDSAETDEQILARAGKALDMLEQEYGDSNIIIVTHGQFARNMIAATRSCSYHDVPSFVNAETRILNI